jgi:PAS domain S-box-containing protein
VTDEREWTSKSLAVSPESLGLPVLAGLLEASLDGILVVDERRRYVYANAAIGHITGIPREQLIGRDFMENIASHAREAMVANFSSTLFGEPGLRSSTVRRPDGSERDIEYSNVIVTIDDTRYVAAIVRDVTEAHRQELEAATLSRIASSLTLDQPMEATLDTLAEAVVHSTRAVACAVLLVGEIRTHLITVGTYGLPDDMGAALEASWIGTRSTATNDVLTRLEPRVVYDLRAKNLANPDFAPLHSILRQVEWDTLAVLPVVYRNRAIGVLNAYYLPDRPPTDAEVAFLGAISDQAAVAVENARLYQQAQVKAVLEERQRLARELHDSVSQALYGIGLGARTARTLLDRDPLQAAEPIEYVLQLAEAGLTEMRALIAELRPESLEREGVVTAIERHLAAVTARYGVTVHMHLPPEPRIPLELKELVFGMTREALHALVRAGHATEVRLDLTSSDNALILTIQSDTPTPRAVPKDSDSRAVRSLHQRLSRLGGKIAVTSDPAQGTTVTAMIPVEGAGNRGYGLFTANPPAYTARTAPRQTRGS